MTGGPLQQWLVAADASSTWTTSVCTGALILAGAGLLAGRAATTNWLAKDELARLGARPCDERYVFDGKYVTAAGVSAGIDMALALVARSPGTTRRGPRSWPSNTTRTRRSTLARPPQPPPARLVAAQRAASRFASV